MLPKPQVLQCFESWLQVIKDVLMTWPVTLLLDSTLYSLSCVQRATYSLADRLVIQLKTSNGEWCIEALPAPQDCISLQPSPDLARALLLQQLNDFALRERIQQETAGLRELLVKAALSGCVR
ncbi:His-Xaa-Ser system protein HxsD [Pseudomonas oryzihabitans]|jgi:His-Xaa-Ser system protein HxsD|uniref:His-Xaa-Ser system protein HxsD n=2 Tax=Pseudomonas oryzihabitans TaxID=47885 RepID=UPI003B2272B2